MLFDLGRWDEIIAITDELTALDEGIGLEQVRMLGLPYRGLVLDRRGDPTAAAAVLKQVLPKAREAADPQLLAPVLAVAALVAATQEDDPGFDFIRELMEFTSGRADRYRTLFLPELTQICVQRDDLGLARELAAGLSVDLGRVGVARTAAAAALAEAEGRTPDALALYEQASDRWRDFGGVPGLADALLGQGRCLLSLDRRERNRHWPRPVCISSRWDTKAAAAGTEELLAQIVAEPA